MGARGIGYSMVWIVTRVPGMWSDTLYSWIPMNTPYILEGILGYSLYYNSDAGTCIVIVFSELMPL